VIKVDRVIKGDGSLESAEVLHRWNGSILDSTPQRIDAHLYGIWFLRRTQYSNWDVFSTTGRDAMISDLFFPADPLPKEPAVQRKNVGPEMNVVLELVAAYRSQAAGRGNVLNTIASFDVPIDGKIVQELIQSSDARDRIIGIVLEIRASHFDGLQQLILDLPSISRSNDRAFVVSSLKHDFRDDSPSSVSELVRIAGSSSYETDIRDAALTALVAIHSKEALPFLASMLFSDDPAQQMEGVFGLSSFANGCPMQTPRNTATMEYLDCKNPSSFRTADTVAAFAFRRGTPDQEAQLVQFWRAWWNSNKGRIIR
jgi:hypothetical protein